MIEKIIDAVTGEETIRELSKAEISELNLMAEESKKIQELADLENAKKQEAKSLLLAKLGITEEEAKLLLG